MQVRKVKHVMLQNVSLDTFEWHEQFANSGLKSQICQAQMCGSTLSLMHEGFDTFRVWKSQQYQAPMLANFHDVSLDTFGDFSRHVFVLSCLALFDSILLVLILLCINIDFNV